jgi:hypothetical protein
MIADISSPISTCIEVQVSCTVYSWTTFRPMHCESSPGNVSTLVDDHPTTGEIQPLNEGNPMKKAPKNLDKVWSESLAMWKSISTTIEEYARRYTWNEITINNDFLRQRVVDALKIQWLIDHGYDPRHIRYFCFFCDYNFQKGGDPPDCSSCPGLSVDSTFDCREPAYHYYLYPVEFYRRLVLLNKTRCRIKSPRPNTRTIKGIRNGR